MAVVSKSNRGICEQAEPARGRGVALQTLADILYERFAVEMLSWDADLTADIYALSVYIDMEEADTNQFEILLSYNTRQQVRQELSRARSEQDAMWDFGHWVQDFRTCVATHDAGFGSDRTVPQVMAWLKTEGLYRSASDLRALIEAEDYEAYHDYYEALEDGILDAAVEAVRRLHETGIVLSTFGRHIPIILHQDAFYPPLLQETREANPDGLVQPYEDWVSEQ